jgi:hypothetical protein
MRNDIDVAKAKKLTTVSPNTTETAIDDCGNLTFSRGLQKLFYG